jgi:hypothetical protein
MSLEVDPDDLKISAHSVIDHAGIAGVGDLTTAAHSVINHAGIAGVGDLTTAAHAVLNHAGIAGVGTTILTFSRSSAGPGTQLVFNQHNGADFLECPVPYAGTLERLIGVWGGGGVAELEVRVNGVIVFTTPNSGPGVLHNLGSIAFAAGDTLAVHVLSAQFGSMIPCVNLAINY